VSGSDEGSGVALSNNYEEMYGSSAGLVRHSMGKFYRLKQLGAWLQGQPALLAMVVIMWVYYNYLPTTTYVDLYYDSKGYWNFAEKYFETGRFEFLSYFNIQRGYLFPLLLSPFTQLAVEAKMLPIEMTRYLGAATAALVFGWAGPALWQAVKGGPAVSLGRRLLFAGLGFVLWRDYFNFSLTDFPALFALAAALIALLRGRGVVSAVVAGVAVAAATNMRPVYQVALPAVGLLALVPPLGRAQWWGLVRGGALVLGAAAVLLPQAYTNSVHVNVRSPWVLTTMPGQPSLFVQQLQWGLKNQKYETNIGDDYQYSGMTFVDERGKAMWEATGLPEFSTATQYVQLCLGRPWRSLGVWQRHLFNALDVQYPTPYIQEVFVPTWPLAWLNYSLIFGGLLVLLLRPWQRPRASWVRPALVLLALLLPCLLALPTAIECRFLLPLHLLLSAAVAFGATPLRWWRAASARARGLVVAGYVATVVSGFSASASAQKHLYEAPRDIWHTLPLHELLPAEEAQPW